MNGGKCTHFSLNALRIRSTSISRWKADASRLSSLSSSASEIAGVGAEEGLFDGDFDDEEDAVVDMVVVRSCSSAADSTCCLFSPSRQFFSNFWKGLNMSFFRPLCRTRYGGRQASVSLLMYSKSPLN